MSWRQRAACWDTDPNLFFPTLESNGYSPTQRQQAVTICRNCPVRKECLITARINGETYGIWGGVNMGTRR